MSKDHIPNPLTPYARTLRHNSAEVEKRLWYRLRDRQLDGHKFRRQHTVNGYILDFACEASRIGIELDGGQHNDSDHQRRDTLRSENLAKSGWHIMRFWNNEVIENIEGVLVTIQQSLTRNAQERFDLSRGRG